MAVTANTSLESALPDPERVVEVRARLEEAGVQYVLSCWIDLLGVPKTKPVPISEWEELCAGRGPQFAVHSVSMVPELGPADPDQIPIPDLDSVVVCPWDHRYAWVFADLYWEGAPYAVCPRSALKQTIRDAATSGYAVYAGIEPEFIIMRYDDQGRPVKAFDNDPDGPFRPKRQAFGYDVEFSLDAMPFLDELARAIDELGWGLGNMVAEGAYSQFELDFGYTDALAAADRLTLLRVLIKETAKKQGTFATFMPKPTQGDWRSGAHINHSIRRAGGGHENLFKGADGWDPAVGRALAGLLRHAKAVTAVTCPTVNSYKGLVGQVAGLEGGTVTWAPTHISYGHNNRSTMFRLPQARWAIENRAADMCMNSYLALAMTIAASVEGLVEELEAPPPLDRDVYAMPAEELSGQGVERLPRNLLEAVEAFDDSPLAQKVFGADMHDSYSRYKHDEWERYHQHVSEWEQAEYLRFF
jgi:glutamine synthetase